MKKVLIALLNLKNVILISVSVDLFFVCFYLNEFFSSSLSLNALRIHLAVTFFLEFVVFLILYTITPYSTKLIDPKHTYRYMIGMRFRTYLKYSQYLKRTEKAPKGRFELKDIFGILSLLHLGLTFLVELLM